MAGYQRIKDDPEARAAQDNSLVTIEGLRMASEIATDNVTTAQAALDALDALIDSETDES